MSFRQPPAHVGMPVVWYLDGDTNNVYAATILKVHAETVCLRVFGGDADFIKDSPRFLSDPRSKDTDKHDEGLWGYTPISAIWGQKRMDELVVEEEEAALAAELAEAEKNKTAK